MTTQQSKTGTREWSDVSVNCCKGCSNSCTYCYAREMALRFKRIPTGQAWETEQINPKALTKKHRKYDGVVMFPTTHDITMGNLSACIDVLYNLLDAGNKVLIVSKPKSQCIQSLCSVLDIFKDQIEFRFSIGGTSHDLDFWEPNAPSFRERLHCLSVVTNFSFKVSISCEPLLSPWGFDVLLASFGELPETIWIGCANFLKQRCKWKLPPDHPKIIELLEWQTPEKIMEIHGKLKDNPRIRWKDSYREVIEKEGGRDETARN